MKITIITVLIIAAIFIGLTFILWKMLHNLNEPNDDELQIEWCNEWSRNHRNKKSRKDK